MKRTGFQRGEVATPHSGRLATALQSVAYTFESALADILDNSVAAGAKDIRVEIRNGRDESGVKGPYILIVDNGSGMTKDVLVNAMRYATETEDDILELGRFGLGMKTASLSQARRMIVASRHRASDRYAVRAWDLDYLNSGKVNGEWRLLTGTIGTLPSRASKLLKNSRGTAVFWDNLVRLIPDLGNLNVDQLDDRLNALVIRATDHLSLVFHRYLAGEALNRNGEKKRRVRIFVNGHPLKPWDPFLRHHEKVIVDGERVFTFSAKPDTMVDLAFEAYIMPRRGDFPSDREFSRAGLINKWNAGQGLYIYRLDRLIKAGGWHRLRANDEHTKLSRISVDLNRAADTVMDVNIQKSRITLPADIRPVIKDWVGQRAARARDVYDGKKIGKGRKRGKSATGSGTQAGVTKRAPAKKVTEVISNLWSCCENYTDRRSLKRLVKKAYPGHVWPK